MRQEFLETRACDVKAGDVIYKRERELESEDLQSYYKRKGTPYGRVIRNVAHKHDDIYIRHVPDADREIQYETDSGIKSLVLKRSTYVIALRNFVSAENISDGLKLAYQIVTEGFVDKDVTWSQDLKLATYSWIKLWAKKDASLEFIVDRYQDNLIYYLKDPHIGIHIKPVVDKLHRVAQTARTILFGWSDDSIKTMDVKLIEPVNRFIGTCASEARQTKRHAKISYRSYYRVNNE